MCQLDMVRMNGEFSLTDVGTLGETGTCFRRDHGLVKVRAGLVEGGGSGLGDCNLSSRGALYAAQTVECERGVAIGFWAQRNVTN